VHVARILLTLLFCCSLHAQDQAAVSRVSSSGSGSFYLNGIVYEYASQGACTVVAAVRPALNHKYLAVKLRVMNGGEQPVTVKPEDILVRDVLAEHSLAMVSATELAKRMRRPYNWARLAVDPGNGPPENDPSHPIITPEMLGMMRAMAMAKPGSTSGAVMAPDRNVLFTDTPGTLPMGPVMGPLPTGSLCAQVCQLLRKETATADVLVRLQKQNTPDYVEQTAFLANTIAPQGEAVGVLFYPMPTRAQGSRGKKHGTVLLKVPVGSETFELQMTVE